MADTLVFARRTYTLNATGYALLCLAPCQGAFSCLSRLHPLPRTPRLMLLLTLTALVSLIVLYVGHDAYAEKYAIDEVSFDAFLPT
jgi:hypothetical protein